MNERQRKIVRELKRVNRNYSATERSDGTVIVSRPCAGKVVAHAITPNGIWRITSARLPDDD